MARRSLGGRRPLAAQRRPGLGWTTATARRPGRREERVPAHVRAAPGSAGGTLARLRSAARALHTPDGAGGGAVRVDRDRLGRRAPVAHPFSNCMRERVRAMESPARSASSSSSCTGGWPSVPARVAGRPPWWRDATARRRSPLRVLRGRTPSPPTSGDGRRDGIATAWAACSPTRPFASPRHTASARSTSCAGPSRTSIASEPPTGGIGRGCCRTDRAARCLRLDIERATWLIGRAVTPLFVERDGPRTAARRGPPDARP